MSAGGLRARGRLAPALALVLAACNLQMHPGGDRFVPFGEIQGQLQPELENSAPPPAPPSGTLRVVTYNVHYADDVPALTAAFLDDPALAAASIALLEEIDARPGEPATRAALLARSIGMNHAYAPAWAYSDGGTHGLAVLSRYPITSAGVLDLPYFELGASSERRIALRATIQIGDRELVVVAIHLDTRINVNDRLAQLSPAAQLADASCIFGGDFNTLPFVWAERYLPLLPQDSVAPVDVAGAVDELMTSQGFAAPTAQSGDTTNNALGNFKIDSIYVRGYEAVASGVERSVQASDHFPLWIDVAWPP